MKPRVLLCLGKKGGGKSALLETCAVYHRKIIDLLGCYDDKTEVLTEGGWKLFSELGEGDRVATLDQNNNLLYQLPVKLHKYYYKGDMVAFKGKSDLLVTPNHRMLVEVHGKRQFITAEEILQYASTHTAHHTPYHLLKTAKWNCEDIQQVILPPSEPTHHTKELLEKYIKIKQEYHRNERSRNDNGTYGIEDKSIRTLSKKYGVSINTISKWINTEITPLGLHHSIEKTIPIDNYLKVLGWYLAEGSVGKLPTGASISFALNHNNQEEINHVSQILRDAGFKPHICKSGLVRIYSTQLYDAFKPLGDSHTKYIPQWVKNLPAPELKILLHEMILGDGTIITRKEETNEFKSASYTTVSKRLADDIQEICMKTGYASSLSVKPPTTKLFNGRAIINTGSYNLFIHTETNPSIAKSSISTEPYEGYVYCVSVPPTETVFVRRGGKVCWSGNSRDNENLCWLRKSADPNWKILLVHGDNVDLVSSWDTCKISELTLSKMLSYDIVTTADSFYSSQKSRYDGLSQTCDQFWGRLSWDYSIAVVMREASNFMYSRIAQTGIDVKSAKAEFIVFQRELRHMGFSPYLDTIRWTSIDKEMRDLADYLIIKKLGAQGLPKDLGYLYKYIAPIRLADLPPHKFLIHTENAAIGHGTSECPAFHKEEGVDLMAELGIQVTVGEEIEDSTEQRIGDNEHANIVRLYAVGPTGSGEGLSMINVAKHVHRSSRSVQLQLLKHNKAVDAGGCRICNRVNSDLWNVSVDRSRRD